MIGSPFRRFRAREIGASISFSRFPLLGNTFRIIPLVFFPLLFASFGAIYAREIEVCKTCPVQRLQKAVQMASPGDVIRVRPGVYREGVVKVFKSLKIRGQGRPVIDGLRQGHVFYVRADNVEISGLVIQNSGTSYISDFAGIRAEHVKNLLIKDNELRNNTYSIYFEKANDSVIRNNRITGNAIKEVSAGNGIHLFYSNQITVEDNFITRQRDGLYFEFAERSRITGNTSWNNLRFGMHFMFSHDNVFENNVFTRNPTGVAIMYSRRLTVRRNLFEKSRGASSYGILVKEITDSKFQENVFRENTLGIMLNGSNRNIFSRNIFRSNGWAAEVYTNSYDNVFTNNNFLYNNFDVATNSRRNTNTFKANYWDRYRGYDWNRDGVGDVPYRPVSIFSFWVARYQEMAVLLNSPVARFLEIAERVFPVITPPSLMDAEPRMKPLPLSPEEMLKKRR